MSTSPNPDPQQNATPHERSDSPGSGSPGPDQPGSRSPGDGDGGTGHGEGERPNPLLRFFRLLGPGLVTGAADDDPSGVATYSQAGALYGSALLWTVPLCLPMMMATQEMADRMTIATGDSLGRLIRRRFAHGTRAIITVLVIALLVANTLNLSADLMAIGQGMELLHAGPAALWSALVGVGIAIAVVAGSFDWIGRIFKWLCLVLLVYVAVLFTAQVDWGDVARGLAGLRFLPTTDYLGLAVAVLGTSVSPYMFFWQTAQRVEEMREEDPTTDGAPRAQDERPAKARRRLRNARVDVFTGMAFSVLIMFAIIAATAATLGASRTEITTAADAAKALEPLTGSYSTVLFAIGFIASGILAVPVLAASGAAGLSALLDKPWGLERSPRRAKLFYALLAGGILGGIPLAVFADDPIQILVLSSIVNSIAAGPFLVIMMLISTDRRIMGRFRSGALARTAGWITTAIMSVGGAYGVWYAVFGGGS